MPPSADGIRLLWADTRRKWDTSRKFPGRGAAATRVQRTRPLSILAILWTMNLIQGHEATCPHCWEAITLTLDLSVPEQSYIEDCPVCCKPMQVAYSAVEGELDALSVDPCD